MNALLTVTAMIELAAGLSLASFPSVTALLLLGARLDTPAAVTLGRVAGAALLSLGVACWLARGDAQSRPARGLVFAMVLYNIAVALFLAFAGIGARLVGVALWPAIALHAAMACWCIGHLLTKPPLMIGKTT